MRDAIGRLTEVWGGYYLPLLDRNSPLDEITNAARVYDLDSLYADDSEGELADLLRVPGYSWRGRGAGGPFPTQTRYHSGLVAARLLGAPRSTGFGWPDVPALDLLYAAYLGFYRESAGEHDNLAYDISPVETSKTLLRPSLSYVDPLPRGAFVVGEQPRDVVWFWNCRALGGDAYPLSSTDHEFNSAVLAAILRNGLPKDPSPNPDDPVSQDRTLTVWGTDRLSEAARAHLVKWAADEAVSIVDQDHEDAAIGAWFPGFEPAYSRSFRIEVDSGSLFANIPLPRLPLSDQSAYVPGVVAAEIHVEGDLGLDPRLTTNLPPHRRHAKLLEGAFANGVRHVRISRTGPVLAVPAGADEVSLPIAYNLEVMQLLFDDTNVLVSQSDQGQFQSRAAEMLGGPTSGVLNRPGMRAALEKAGEKQGGVTLQELRDTASRHRGAWPDALFSFNLDPRDYAHVETNRLLASGLLVPMLDVQCTFCRVVNRVHPNDLGAVVRCDFCGEDFPLALGLALAKPAWRYRLAGHLAPDKVRAMLPALATLSTLNQLSHSGGPRLAHVLGLEVTLPASTPVEVDVAAMLPDDDWTVVLGEVKNQNRVDAQDVLNLARLQRQLLGKEVNCVILFATLKEEFSPEEQVAIRKLTELNNAPVSLHHGSSVPLVPLLFTGPDLSLPWGDENHPWRWAQPGSGQGIFGIALESCRRNLGLMDYTMNGTFSHPEIEFKWHEPLQ